MLHSCGSACTGACWAKKLLAQVITKVAHGLVAPSASGLSVRLGFHRPQLLLGRLQYSLSSRASVWKRAPLSCLIAWELMGQSGDPSPSMCCQLSLGQSGSNKHEHVGPELLSDRVRTTLRFVLGIVGFVRGTNLMRFNGKMKTRSLQGPASDSLAEVALREPLGLWKRKTATGPEQRNHSSGSKETKRDFFLFRQRDSKVTKKRLFNPQKSILHHFRDPKVLFWSLLSLFVERGKSVVWLRLMISCLVLGLQPPPVSKTLGLSYIISAGFTESDGGLGAGVDGRDP